MVIAHGAIAEQDLVDQFLTVDAVFQGMAHMHVAVGLGAGIHGEGIVLGARNRVDLNVGASRQKADGLEVKPVGHVHVTRHKRGGAGVLVNDGDHLGAVEPGNIAAPVVGVALQRIGNAGLEIF